MPIIYANQYFADIVVPERGSVKCSRNGALHSRKGMISQSLVDMFDPPARTDIVNIVAEESESSRTDYFTKPKNWNMSLFSKNIFQNFKILQYIIILKYIFKISFINTKNFVRYQ